MQAKGHCHCGAVGFAVDGEVLRMGQCHCEACRRTTGTGHGVQAFFARSAVTINGETRTHESIADSGNLRTRHFCPVCGSRLFSENSRDPSSIGIAVGAFDESDWFKPGYVVYSAMRPAWDVVDPAIPAK